MLAIYKKEFKSYFISMIGYAFVAFLLLVLGLVYYIVNIKNASPFIGYVLNNQVVTIVLLVLIPVITMKAFAEERQSKTDQMLFTAPVSVTKVVMGKFLAAATIFTIPLLVFSIYPLILTEYGTVPVLASYVAILGFWLEGLAYFAICIFISSITDNQIISAVVSFAVLLATVLCEGLANVLPTTAIFSLIAYMVLVAVAAVMYYMITRGSRLAVIISAAVLVVGEVATVILYFVKQSIFESGFQKFLLLFSVNHEYENFTSNYFDVTAVVYYVSIIVFFVFLTNQSIQKRRWS